jgi:RNA polymerase sigma-70 factor (ECF subfamily)
MALLPPDEPMLLNTVAPASWTPGAAGRAVDEPDRLPQPAAVPVDDERLARARAGDELAFAELVRRHQGTVFSVALRVIGNRALAEELAQDVFLQLHRSLSTLESGAHVTHWLRRVVSHRAIDLVRQQARRPQTSLSDLAEPAANAAMAAAGTGGGAAGTGRSDAHLRFGGDGPAGPDGVGETAADPFLARRLRELLASLPPGPRAVVTLRFQEDLDLSEIAAVLEMPLNTVKSHLRRSLALLRGRAQALLEPKTHVSRT